MDFEKIILEKQIVSGEKGYDTSYEAVTGKQRLQWIIVCVRACVLGEGAVNIRKYRWNKQKDRRCSGGKNLLDSVLLNRIC